MATSAGWSLGAQGTHENPRENIPEVFALGGVPSQRDFKFRTPWGKAYSEVRCDLRPAGVGRRPQLQRTHEGRLDVFLTVNQDGIVRVFSDQLED
eukprot:CAMPEP_0175559694 /NCGR_PEP_ID=MMETSP0096-20121207/36531_1 /TAXON_ID=311494 /ORGANISM="Alexandrium monilatum, Strain CCMP3105" /LENGTH=94 /DNA_ID=CAMNT_0016862899 /DNA_START=60 /DNA_END=344 /DNA_ORIENTATION=-